MKSPRQSLKTTREMRRITARVHFTGFNDWSSISRSMRGIFPAISGNTGLAEAICIEICAPLPGRGDRVCLSDADRLPIAREEPAGSAGSGGVKRQVCGA